MPHWREPERANASSKANWEVARTLIAVALIVASLWLLVYVAATLFDPYVNKRPVHRQTLISSGVPVAR